MEFAFAIHATAPVITSPVPIFLVVLLIILFAPILLAKLKIPHVIGLILAGVVVGPYGVNLLARDMSFEVFGQVGILYLMFLAGIEIDMYHLKKNLKKGIVFGLYTFFIPLLFGAVASSVFLHLDALTSVLLASMFAAHTLIAYPIVSRFGLNKSPAVIIVIAGTIFTVLGSLMVLAGAVGVFKEGEFRVLNSLRLFGGLLLYVMAVTYVYPRITRWFFKRYNDNITQFIYVLSMVFLAAQVAILIGIEGVFGAFFAGLVLNRYIPSRSALMTRIEFVGNAIFIPYFLIGVGMLINIRVVASDWNTIYVAGVMSVTSMICKWLAAYATQRSFKLSTVDRSILYQLSNAHTAVALAVVMIGFDMGIFDEAILNGTIIMILITCTVSSLGTYRAAMKLKILQLSTDELAISSEREKQQGNVLIPISNPATATQLVDLALMMRGQVTERSNVYALYVRNDNTPMSRAIGRNSLDIAERTAASVDQTITGLERYDLNFVTGVINAIEERDIDQVVIGLHRRTTVIDSFFGDKLMQLLKATHRMVVISRCFIPVNTVTRIVVTVPEKAQYETGFSRWVCAIANLTRQLGCRVIFCCYADTRVAISNVLRSGRYDIRSEYREVTQWDDFILLANRILDDDLFVVVNARRASISFTSDMDTLPDFLQKYFSNNNLIVIYPEQFGEQPAMATMAENLSTDIVSAPSPLWVRIMNYYRAAIRFRKRFTHRNRPNKIEL